MINPHGMDPQTVLRFLKASGGWPGKVVVIACEPAGRRADGVGAVRGRTEAVDRAVDLVFETVGEMRAAAPAAEAG